MTPQQIELVQSSFTLVEPILEPAAMMFYDRLFQLDPSLRPLFRTPFTRKYEVVNCSKD